LDSPVSTTQPAALVSSLKTEASLASTELAYPIPFPMTIEQLQSALTFCLAEKKCKPTDEVKFRHSIKESNSIFSSVDYVLIAQVPNSIVLCYDDGMM